MCALVSATTGWMVWQQKKTVVESAAVNLQAVSRAVADQVDRAIGSLELAQNKLIDRISLNEDGGVAETRSPADDKALHDIMQDLVASTAEAYRFVLVDANGDVPLSSFYWPSPKLDMRDRDYFKQARAHPEIIDSVSTTVMGKATGRAAFALLHVFRKADGQFGGMLVSFIDVGYLEDLFSSNPLPPGGTITLLRSDGVMLAHYPHMEIIADPAQDDRFRGLMVKAGAGAFRRAGIITGRGRLMTVINVPAHPFTMVVSEPLENAIAAWRVQALAAALVAMMGCLATITTVTLALSRIRDQRRLQLAELSLVTAEQHAKFGEALDNMNQALLMFGHDGKLIVSNAPVRTMFGLRNDGLRPGMTMRDVLGRVRGTDSVIDNDDGYQFYHDMVVRNERTAFSRRLQDGRFIAGHFAPIEAGWLLTFEDVTEARRTDERIEQMALHDALTGLPNRFQLRIRTEDALLTLRDGTEFAVMYLDLDAFKNVNDTLGHAAGDKLLCLVCKRIAAETRPEDIVARLGGDEFAILVCPAPSNAYLSNMAERLVEVISEPYAIDGQLVTVGVSIGIAVAPRDGLDTDTLMKNADLALYRAKNEGRGTYRVFEPSMWQQAIDRRRLETELQHALLNGEFELFYQPIIAVRTRKVAGFEALIRWRHPSRDLVSPLNFISVAEENGSIIHIGEWALNRACREAATWPSHIKVAVNLSPVQFRGGTLVGIVENALAVSGLAAGRLELEITESTMMQDTDATLETLETLKALGVRIAMDDFGTGYSSLAYLQKFPFDKIKIDQAFVRDINTAGSLAIVRAVTSIAASLRIDTLAEGIETEEQLRRVAEEGCEEAQGFLFGVPCPAIFVDELLAAERRGYAWSVSSQVAGVV